jgi:hypothetical protein
MLELAGEMKKWWDSLSVGSANRRSLHLRLEHCLVRMFVGRPFLFSRAGVGITPSATSESGTGLQQPAATSASKASTENSTRSSRTSTLVDDCVQAALEVIEIGRSMRDNGIGIAKSSYIEYSSCRASLLVLIAYCIQNQTDEYYHSLQQGLDIIREMSATGDSARYEVLLIETLEKAIKRLHFFSREVQTHEAIGPESTAGYSSFKQWSSMWKTGVATGNQSNTSQQPLSNLDRQGASSGFRWRTDEGQPEWTPRAITSNANTGSALGFLEADSTGLGHLQSAAGSAFFGLESTNPTSDLYTHPERQLMETFLAVPEYQFPFSNGFNGGQQFG